MVDQQPEVKYLKLLNEVSLLLTSLDLKTVIQQVINLMTQAVEASTASLLLRDEHDIDWDNILLTRDLDHRQSVNVVRTVMDEGLAGWVMRHRQGAVVADTFKDARWHVFADDNLPMRSALCVPLMYEDHCLAVLTLVHPQPGHFDQNDLDLVTIVANQAAVAIRTVQLFRQTQAQQRQLETVLRALPEVILVTDSNGRIVQVNDEAQHILAPDGQPLVGRAILDFDPQQYPGVLLAPAWHILKNPTQDRERWPYEVRDEAHRRDYHAVMSIWRESHQQHGYAIIMHDVTHLRDLHRFKDDMLQVVSHDLRNPISLITTAREMIHQDLPPGLDDSYIPQYLDIIQQSTERMEQLIEELLTADTSSQQQVDLISIVQETVERLRPLAERKQQQLSLCTAHTDLLITVDPLLIGEAMENYISNAIKYTPPEGHIHVKLYTEGEKAYYIVEDNGIGVSAEHLPHIFEPYYRLPGTIEQGYGIGLNLVKTIIERHLGETWAESEENTGSQFGFWLPL